MGRESNKWGSSWTYRREEESWNSSLPRLANWNRHILRRDCLLHDAIEGQMMEMLDDLKSKIRYWKLKEEDKDLKRYRTDYQSNLRKKYKVHGPANKQHT